ncbi:related to WD repeat and FYVE domain-containing protein 3 [Serendipita indica DSM 11827]|uniref:Related to WD repeat and FYVE domain-containing protein 3 n=1 Tax=Serendipita indica (strain DSM 11827) TaxID=1109443 RepID=G4TU38_SERID|nr:related to WD repeat and FYVE domain-containing protein 3 [Serendipita indica DSM 11827]
MPLGLFFDGNFVDSLDVSYPRLENSASTTYYLGDDSNNAQAIWSMASAYLISMPMGNELPRLFHHLGPRYFSNFQAAPLVRFFTYEAATSLSIYLQSLMDAKRTPSAELSALLKGAKDGTGVQEESILFALTPAGYQESGGEDGDAYVINSALRRDRVRDNARIVGDVAVVKPQCLDVSVWKIGGAAIPLRLVEMSQNSHDLANSLSVLFDSLRTSWQNSEDMERIHGYETLGLALRSKISLIDIYVFTVVFDFLGIDLNHAENATVTNPLAYSILALEFDIWARAPKEVQKAHLSHFTALLQTSKFRRFNLKQRLSKFNIPRKLLYVLQGDLYSNDMIPQLVQTVGVYLRHHFVADVSIKPVVSYLAANLHDDVSGVLTPRSIVTKADHGARRERAEQVYEILVQSLSNPTLLSKFTLSLPLSRVLLLLLGEHPSPIVASQTLTLLGLVLSASPSFNRKFELVSGWSALKVILPPAWDPSVHVAAFDLLLGRTFVSGNVQAESSSKIVCPYILPAILTSLAYGLEKVTAGALLPPATPSHGVTSHGAVFSHESYSVTSAMEVLVEELIDLHSSISGFRQLFKSKSTTTILINACQSFVARLYEFPHARQRAERLLNKVITLVTILAYDTSVESQQKEQLLAIPRLVEYSKQKSSGEADGPKLAVDPAMIPLPSSPQLFSTSTFKHLLQAGGGERMLQKSLIRIAEWRKKTIATEKKRRGKMIQDQKEFQRQAERHTEWRTLLHSEYGIWPRPTDRYMWRLDDTEGPFRVRKKLELEHVKVPLHARIQESDSREVREGEDEAQETVQVEVPPWEESYEFAATEVEEEQQWDEDMKDDKHRRVRHELEPGDVIQDVRNVTRVTGVDASPGLLILGKTHLYMLDGLLVQEDGEIIEAQDAPKDILLVPGTIVELDGPQPAQRWLLERIATFSKRTFLFRDVALEIYMKDSRSIFVVFPTQKDRQEINDKFSFLMNMRAASDAATSPAGPMLRSPFLSRVTARVFTGARDDIASARSRWQTREISNFAYLSILNQASGRTRCDVTQYPVFPWVLQDYTSEELDLTKPETFRNLSRPMGALTPAREEAAQTRYTNLESVNEPPFHYGTHFSSSMIVCHFLIRLSPFTHMFKTLQGGDWDLPDRLFTDIKRAWDSASQDSRGDVRELIPEFYTLPEFLSNTAGLDFGRQTSSGEKINDVKLPAWAKNDPLLFITLHRQALESDYVSRNLPAWIDLIWGCKQKDPSSFNVFHPLSYEGAIDLDAISDPLEREATVGIIHNFGQTPRKLFTHPHPQRIMDGRTSLPLGTLFGVPEDAKMLSQGAKPLRQTLNAPVTQLVYDAMSEKILPCSSQMLHVPLFSHETVHWGSADQSIRLHIDKKLVQVAEGANCICAAFADSESLITGMEDSTIGIWKLTRVPGERTVMTWTHILRGHIARVNTVAASRAWSLVASGSDDNTVILWDLNRAHYVRTLQHDTSVQLVAIHEASGMIASSSKTSLVLHTINGHHITTLNMFSQDPVFSLAFHEREWSKTGVLATGSRGTVTLRSWNVEDSPPGETARWKWTTLHEYKCRKVDNGDPPTVTSLKFVGESLYSGDDTGKVYLWEFPE